MGAKKDKVAAAILGIKQFHALGRKVPVKRPHGESYQQDVLGVTGERLGVHSETVRQARQFADPESGYTQAEVEELCRAIRDIQSESEAGGVFSKTHVVRILTIPKATRAKFQMEAIRGGWSTNRLESEISSRFGSRRQGGRKREIPREAAGLLA